MNEINYDNLIFFDLETSGLDFKKHEIIQIAAVDAATGDSFMRRVDFDVDKAELEALQKNGFDVELWDAEGQPASTVCKEFGAWVKDHARLDFQGKTSGKKYKLATLCGYNILGFDKFFITEFFKSNGEFLPADYRMFDIYQLALWKYPNLQKYDLESMCKMLDIKCDHMHDALNDVYCTIELAKHIFAKPLRFKKLSWV